MYFQLTIVDVFDRDHVVCKTDDDKVLEGEYNTYFDTFTICL